MGCMSASDAAPLPRLGEVFFDVRGDSRSMRLSWYADTGVAVFSIWQGGTCTGTFRLPMDDLSRMIEALHRGPKGQRGRRDSTRREMPAEPADRDASGERRALAGSDGSTDPGQATAAMQLPGPPGDAGAPRPGGRADPGYAAPGAGYPAAPAGGRRRRDPGYADPLSPDYRGSPDYQPDPLSRDYQADPLSPDYRGSLPDPGYRDVPGTGDYRRVPADPGYSAGPLDYSGPMPGYSGPSTGDSRRIPADPGYLGPRGHPEGPDYLEGPPVGDFPAAGHDRWTDPGYPGDPVSPGYPGPAGSHRREVAGYPDDPAYQGDTAFRNYPRQPGIGDYSGEPPARDSGGYPVAGDYGREDDWDDTADRSMDSYGDPAPESHPYGPPPANRESRGRGRYPGRH